MKRQTASSSGWTLTALALAILVGSLAVSPNRFLPLPFAAVGLYLGSRWGMSLRLWLLALPWVALVNLPQLRAASAGGLYPSEALLIAAFVGLLARGYLAAALPWRRGVSSIQAPESGGDRREAGAAWSMLAFAGWVMLAALVVIPHAYLPNVVRQLRLALLAWSALALGMTAIVGAGRQLGTSLSLLVAGLGAMVLVEAWAFGGGGRVPLVGRLVGGSELLAIHLTLLWPLPLALALAAGANGRQRLLAWLAVALGVAALAISYSRSGWAGGWAATLTVAGLIWWVERRRLVALVGLLGLLATVAAVAVLMGWLPLPGVPDAYLARFQTLGGAELFGDRATEWQRGTDAIRRSPWWGQPGGPNCYNLVLQLAVASGVAVLVPFLLLIGFTVRAIIRTCARGGGEYAWLAAGCAGALVGLLVTGIGESSLGTRVMPLAMLVIGVAIGLPEPGPRAPKAPSPGD